jgi:ricin-type beta-trefoil lectin protein
MRKSRRLFVPLAVTALVAGGGLGLGLGLVANAQTEIAQCSSAGTPISCTIASTSADTTVLNPSTIQALVTLIPPATPSSTSTTTSTPTSTSTTTAPSDLYIQLDYSVECFDSNGNESPTSQLASPGDEHAITTSVTVTLSMGYTNPHSCTVLSLTGTLEHSSDGTNFTPATTGSFTMELEWTPTASASTSTSSSSVNVSVARGYDGKCLDDRGNSSANRAAVIIWGCNSHDSAQGFTYSGGELKHNGKCVNDQGNGGSGTHLILWTCNGATNEKWFHSGGDGEFVLTSQTHGLLCIDDPGNSKTNGTRLIVWKCKNTSNQHWT